MRIKIDTDKEKEHTKKNILSVRIYNHGPNFRQSGLIKHSQSSARKDDQGKFGPKLFSPKLHAHFISIKWPQFLEVIN